MTVIQTGVQRSPAVTLHQPDDQGSPWVAEVAGQYLRLGADAGRLLASLDGRRPEDLAAQLGAPWTGSLVEEVLGKFEEAGLLHNGRANRHPARLRFCRPLTLQFVVVHDAARFLRPVARIARRVPSSTAIIAMATLVTSGLIALAAQSSTLVHYLSAPVSPGPCATLVAALIAANVAHELSHAIALLVQGGRPSRLGFMLFYLAPALFCDVSDAWRLPTRRGRVAVALAGPAMQFAAGAVASLLATNVSGDVRWVLLMFSFASFFQGAVNLCPLLKLDGYIALMAWRDESFLRQHAMERARAAIARVIFGGHLKPDGPDWLGWYGLGCLLAPWFLVANGVIVVLSAIAGLGAVALGVAIAVVAVAAARIVLFSRSMWLSARTSGSGLPRAVSGGLAVLALALLVMLIPVKSAVPAAWWVEGDTVRLALPKGFDANGLHPGQIVEMQRQGVALRPEIGSARVASTIVERRDVPVAALVPFTVDWTAQMRSVVLAGRAPDGTIGGPARIQRRARPLARVVFDTLAGAAVGHR